MAIKKISIESFLELAKSLPVFDVRSPGEYNHACIPEAHNLPLFTDEERKVVGTLYKQQGRQRAIKAGLDYFSPKMKGMVETVEKTVGKQSNPLPPIIIHCWRGGMRSAAVAWLMDLYGFEVYTLVGGYKSFRRWTLRQFERDQDIRILGGFTGSGKTDVLHELKASSHRVIDLEGLAHHKGSAFGALGQQAQPTQEMFENLLALALSERTDETCWVEDESQRIGSINIPHPLWNTIRKKTVYFIDIPFEKRLAYLSAGYGLHETEKLVQATMRIQNKLGGLETKNTINFLLEGKTSEAFSILLRYYDKLYEKSLQKRENPDTQVNRIPVEDVNSRDIMDKLLSFQNV